MFAGRHPMLRAAALATATLGGGALALGGCGEDSSGGLASLAPPDTPFYVEAVIRPEGDRAEAINSIAETVAGIDDPGERLVALLEAQLESEDAAFTYAEDIEPWLGQRAAIFVRSMDPSALAGDMPDVAAIVETTDPEAARGFIEGAVEADPSSAPEEARYEGVDYWTLDDGAVGLVDDFLVIGTESSFKAAVDASAGESLGESDPFAEQVGELEDDQLASMWVDLGTALDAAAGATDTDGTEIDAARTALGPLLEEPVALSLAATPQTVTLDSSAAGNTGVAGDTELLGELPADAWFAVALSDAGMTLQQTLEGAASLGAQLGDPSLDPEVISSALRAATSLDLEKDVLPWVGDASLYVAGATDSEFAAGVVVTSSDPDASAAAIEAAGQGFERTAGRPVGPPRLEGADGGFAAVSPTGQGLELALRDERVIAAVGGTNAAADAVEPAESLADSELFGAGLDALGDDYAATGFLGMQDALVVAEAGDDDGQPDYDALGPYLDALDYLIFGTATEGERELSRIVLGIGE